MTIEVPTPSAEFLSQLEAATIETDQSEAAAITAIRECFTVYAKHNGFVRTGVYHQSDGANYEIDREAFHRANGKKVRALLALDYFSEPNTDQNRGTKEGQRLYLTETGEWLEIERTGVWTRWQGEASYWYAGEDAASEIQVEDGAGGRIRALTDAEVAGGYDLDDLLEGLGKSMAEMTKKLPARYARLQQRAELAQRILAATKGGE